MDLLLPNIHPTFETWFNPSDAKNGAAFVLNVAGKLQSQYPQAPYRQGNRASVRARFDGVYRSISKRILVRDPEAVRCFRNQSRFLL